MQGDSFHFVFPFARQAVAAAVAGQRALHEHDWTDEPIRVRIGIHTGEPMQADGLYAGLDVHRAARVMSAAHGSQVLVSARTADLVEGELPDGVGLRQLGEYQLKDFPAAQRLYAVQAAGLPSEFPALTVEPARRRAARPGRRPRWSVLAIALVAVVAAAVSATYAMRDDPSAITAPPNSVAVINPNGNAVLSAVPVGTAPTTIVAGGGAVWTLNTGEQTISRIDVSTRERTRTISAGAVASDIAFADDAIWVADADSDTVSVLDERGGVQARIQLGIPHGNLRTSPPRVALTSYGRQVWATGGRGLPTVVIDADTRRVVRRIKGLPDVDADTGPGGPDIAVDASGAWSTDGTDELFRVDTVPSEGLQFGGFHGDQGVGGIAAGRGFVWAAGAGEVWQIRPSPARPITTFPVGAEPTGIAVGPDSVWTANALDGTVSRISITTGRMTTIPVGGTPSDLIVANGLVWVTVG